MVSIALIVIVSVYHLGEAAMRWFAFGEKKEAADCVHLWKWTAGSLLTAWLLTELNSYLLQQGL